MISIGLRTLIGPLSDLILIPFILGFSIIGLKVIRQEMFEIGDLFIGFKSGKRVLQAYATGLLMTLLLILWTLLLIIPGIIKSFAYSQAFFLIAEDPNLTAMDALRESEKIMTGKKCQLAWLCLRLFGWLILCIFTLGIGLLWWVPFSYASCASFYEKVKGGRTEEEITTWNDKIRIE